MSESRSIDLAFVLLDEPVLPAPEAVLAAHRVIAPTGPPLLADPSSDPSTATFHLGGGHSIVVGLMSAPVPGGEADAKAEYSLSAMGTGWTLPVHRAHLVVVPVFQEKRTPLKRLGAFTRRVLGNEKKLPDVDRLIAFTRAVAAIVSASGAVGVYLGAANATHAARFFVDIASTDEPPAMLMVWNGVSVAKDGDRVSLLSLGMSQLGLPNLLLTAPVTDGGTAIEYMFDLLAYVTSLGEALPEGHTVGRSADERIRVRYQPSPLGDGTEVWRVDL